jgi:uncharacterized RDD family membrane protein YckC
MVTNGFVGFGRRFIAYAIDIIIIILFTTVLNTALIAIVVALELDSLDVTTIYLGIYFMVYISYFIFTESSAKQATFGKLIMKIKVVNSDGDRLSVLNSTIRNFGRILSGLILGLGYIMIVFTPKKQALHDKIAKTYVVNR